MYVARILYPVQVLGPGKRIGIWFAGCPRRCEGCSNPELWEFNEKYNVSLEQVLELIKQIADKHQVDGFTITGGDPFYQFEELTELLKRIKVISSDILIYTGYSIKELEGYDLSNISVLIDGPYIKERNNNCFLRGSDNQNIIILDESIRYKYEKHLEYGKNEIQNFKTSDGVISVGIHNRDFVF